MENLEMEFIEKGRDIAKENIRIVQKKEHICHNFWDEALSLLALGLGIIIIDFEKRHYHYWLRWLRWGIIITDWEEALSLLTLRLDILIIDWDEALSLLTLRSGIHIIDFEKRLYHYWISEVVLSLFVWDETLLLLTLRWDIIIIYFGIICLSIVTMFQSFYPLTLFRCLYWCN